MMERCDWCHEGFAGGAAFRLVDGMQLCVECAALARDAARVSAVDASRGGVALPIGRRIEKGWEYTTVRAWRVRLRGRCPDFRCEWFEIRDGWLTVFPRYAWDGSTGVAEGGLDPVSGLPRTCVASGVHDCGYQFALETARAWGWTRAKVLRFFDDEFFWLMDAWGVARWRSSVRWFGVRAFGLAFTVSVGWLRRVRGVRTACETCAARPCRLNAAR